MNPSPIARRTGAASTPRSRAAVTAALRASLLIAATLPAGGALAQSATTPSATTQAAATPPTPGAAAARGFSAEDLVRLHRVSDPQLSPDGTKLAYVLRETDLDANRGRTDLWLLDLKAKDAAPVRLTRHEANDSSPRWAPDGNSLYFLSTRGGGSQVWRITLGGGEPTQVTSLPVDVDNFRIAPGGRHLVFSATVFRDCADLACTKQRLEQRGKQKETGKAYDALFARHWDTWRDGTRSVLHSVALDADGRAAATPVSLSGSLDGDVPSKPMGGDEEYAISPDGTKVAFAARVAGREEAWSTNLDVYEVGIDGGTPANLTKQNLATDTQPAYSPDGRYLAWMAMARPGFEADRYAIVVRDRQDGKSWELAPAWDRSPHSIDWTADSKAILATADEIGNSPLFRIAPVAPGAPRQVTRLTDAGSVTEVAVAGGTVVYSSQNLGSPAQLYALEARAIASARAPSTLTPATEASPVAGVARTARPLTRANADQLAGVRLGEYEQYSFAGAEGTRVHGWVMKPANFVPGRKYPVAFIVHGGPQVSFANNWSYRWNPQVYAGAGYAVVFVDFHGSPGYGQKFTDSISGNWGGKPLEDLKLGLAAAAQQYPWVDAGNACALGASYGGYMMSWIAGNWADGFKCIVNHAGVFDTRAMGFMTEELWFTEWENGGTPWDPKADYETWNPVRFVQNWKTPMLVLHGEKDFRVPYTQGLGVFTALQRKGIDSRLVMWPDENHWILKPQNSLQWHREVLAWLDRYLKR
jgi:dipeptidyl aminopeptidase/acylaminoacyl peptidase